MKHSTPELRICVWQIDGSTQGFVQSEPELVNRTIADLHSGSLFSHDRIIIADGEAQDSFLPPLITRIDLITDQVTVWDFPFAFGALIELSEGEFLDGVRSLPEPPNLREGTRLFLDAESVSGQRTCLWMEVVAGFPAARMAQIYSLFNERQLIFGLRDGGVGVLNPANLVRFAIFPEPLTTSTVNGSEDHRQENFDCRAVCDRPRNGKHRPAASLNYSARVRFHKK